jgi:mono/diheme cytochrome c family protein
MRIAANIRLLLLLLLGFPWALGGCTHDSEEELYGKPDLTNCDLSQVTYALTVRPILQQNCYSCHASNIAEGNVTLDDYEGVKQQMNNGKLLGSIKHLPGHPPMPQNGPKLSDCNIARITKWFDSGALNN